MNPLTMPDLFQQTRQQWLEGARHAARQLLRRKRTITIEDVLEIYPKPKYLHKNTVGHVLRENEMFHAIGYTLAKKPSSHHRVIRLWTLTDMYSEEREY